MYIYSVNTKLQYCACISMWKFHPTTLTFIVLQETLPNDITSTSDYLSVARRLPCKVAAHSAANFRRRVVHNRLPSHVRRLSVQRTHCDAHSHLPVHQGVYVLNTYSYFSVLEMEVITTVSYILTLQTPRGRSGGTISSAGC